MENEPFPLRSAALVNVLSAPLISRGLKAENEVNRETSPSIDILVRSGSGGIVANGIGLALSDCVTDILLVGDILCVGV
jgi:hypothetical protein